jgi:hypothetical protein
VPPKKDDSDKAARLLLKALESLSQRDRDLVLRNLLTGRIDPLRSPEPSRPHAIGGPLSLSEARIGMAMARQVEQPLLVRLPSDLHARFRRWATSHGFSMASVVRGLVERFLDDQEGRKHQGSSGSRA